MLASLSPPRKPAPLGAALLALCAAVLFAGQASAQYGACTFGGCDFNNVAQARLLSSILLPATTAHHGAACCSRPAVPR